MIMWGGERGECFFVGASVVYHLAMDQLKEDWGGSGDRPIDRLERGGEIDECMI